MQDISCKYQVTNAGSANASCTCPEGQLHYICKHMVKVISVSQGFSGAQIIQALGTRAGSTQEGLAHLYSKTASESLPQTDALTELDSTFALTSSEPEAAAQPAPVPAPASIPAPAHDSTACHQQIQTAVNRMWDMAAGDAEMQQHLLSQINSLEGKLAAIQASHATGTAHPMATLSRVQDTWGNSLVRKRTIGLDGFPKSKRRKTEQPASAAASQPSEAEAAPFSKVKPSRKKVGPRQQAKAASAQSEQENSSAKANSIPPVAPSAAAGQSGKPPRAVRQPRCGRCHTCTHPSLKKGCLQNKEQKALLAAQHT